MEEKNKQSQEIIEDKKRDPMPSPDATPEEIGEFWDTHSLADYWDETHEVEFQVNLKENLLPEESKEAAQKDAFSAKQGWQKLKELIQSIKPKEFEELAAALLTSFLQVPFVVARSGDQPSGDARSETNEISIQAKRYTTTRIDPSSIEGDIRQVIRTLPDLQVYVLAVYRNIASQPRHRFDDIEKETGVDIVTLELTDERSELGILCVTFWEDICDFFEFSSITQQFMHWIENEKENTETTKKREDLHSKLKEGIQTQHKVHKDTKNYLLKRFSRTEGFNPINLSEAVDRKSLESEIVNWWNAPPPPVCCLKGEEGTGKTWIAAKGVKIICERENIVTFWLDSKDWTEHKSIFDLLYTCFNLIYPSYEQGKIAKLQNKASKIWRKTLIVLDGVNERNAIEAAQRLFDEYFRHENEWGGRIRFLLTTRPLANYPDFENYEILVGAFNNSEFQDALMQKCIQPTALPNSLKNIAKFPRYFQRCLELQDELGSFDVVTKQMVILMDLMDKIKRSDPQIHERLGWDRAEDPKDFFLHLAKQVEWNKIDAAPEELGKQLKACFSDYSKIRRDLEEQGIVSEAGLFGAKLSDDYVLLCWALYLLNIFDSMEAYGVEDLFESFQQELEPTLSEDLQTEALFAALQLSAISPNTDLSEKKRSQKRAALMLTWFKSHNAQITDARLSFWAKEDTDAYAQVVEFEFRHHNSPNYEDALIVPLAKVWLSKKGDLNRLESHLGKWIFPPETDIDDTSPEEDPFPTMYYTRNRLLAAALSILSQRPERQFLEKLARCYENSAGKAQFRDDIGRLMRWGYTEGVVGNLHWLAELFQTDASLLKGVHGLADCLRVNLPPDLKRPLTEEDLESRAFVEKWNRGFKSYIDHIRNQERLLIGDSPAANGNYHGLDHLAVRTDLPHLHHEDIVEIKKILKDVSVNAKLGWSVGATFEGFCIENLMPWVAKYDAQSYAELACALKLNALNQKWARLPLSSIQGIMFKPEDRKKMTEAILGMKQRLVQDIQVDNSSSEVISLTSSLTEILLFSASEEQLTDWFEFLASHESIRKSIFYKPLSILLEELLPESIVEFVQQKLEVSLGNQFASNAESEKITEEDFWSWIYLRSSDNDETTGTWAFENLKRKESDLRTMTFCFLDKARLDSNRFLSEIFTDKEVRKHLFLKDGSFFYTPIYEGENSYSYKDLVSVLPQEVVGSFLCSPKRRAKLSRWGKELMERMCSILRDDGTNPNSVGELRFMVNPKVLQTWAIHNRDDFLQLANEYFTLLSESGWYCQRLYKNFMDAMLCLLLRFQPDRAMEYYNRLKTKGVRTIFFEYGGVETFFAQLWRIEECGLPEHSDLRRKQLEECLNDEEIMFMTLAALVGGGEEELWHLVTQEYLESPYAKERNLGVSILPWFGTDEAIEKLDQLKSEDSSKWVREHAAWAYEVAQQEHSCREVYREALQTRDLFRISAVFEQMKPALSPTARWWREIEHKEFREESQDIDSRLAALVYRFWHRWGNSEKTKRNIEVLGRKLREYYRGEKVSAGFTPRIAPWWKPSSD